MTDLLTIHYAATHSMTDCLSGFTSFGPPDLLFGPPDRSFGPQGLLFGPPGTDDRIPVGNRSSNPDRQSVIECVAA